MIPNGGSFIYQYDLKDHLGNTRTSIQPLSSDTTQTTADVIQQNAYYPFGADIPNVTPTLAGTNKYLYNGKEKQEELGGLYDYGARFYDPMIGRWNGVDPLAEKTRRYSPYVYVFNNPLRFIDPDGMDPPKSLKVFQMPKGCLIRDAQDGEMRTGEFWSGILSTEMLKFMISKANMKVVLIPIQVK